MTISAKLEQLWAAPKMIAHRLLLYCTPAHYIPVHGLNWSPYLGTKYPNMIISFFFLKRGSTKGAEGPTKDRTDRNAGRNKLILTVKTCLRSRAAHSLNNRTLKCIHRTNIGGCRPVAACSPAGKYSALAMLRTPSCHFDTVASVF
jgi:hypothetical protein